MAHAWLAQRYCDKYIAGITTTANALSSSALVVFKSLHLGNHNKSCWRIKGCHPFIVLA